MHIYEHVYVTCILQVFIHVCVCTDLGTLGQRQRLFTTQGSSNIFRQFLGYQSLQGDLMRARWHLHRQWGAERRGIPH